jgi:hypothetical protein
MPVNNGTRPGDAYLSIDLDEKGLGLQWNSVAISETEHWT